ncbi:hypothetical protein EFK07_06025 [Pseudomonas putida]|jgi:hypothetical protein|uniref:Uncharacterized protein n=2 Tax=Pseudomonas TaxID=286 RepID=A0A1W6QYP3_PSEPU|nr:MULTISPECIES: hypothetical protein [Pseudomonas]ARO46411.1 Hypothetical protein [Pseudomonas putida]MDD2108088.1 hypothetical protein [Pseudomonas asiatica]RNF92653.1 hypothetical protein EFK07_06025 [Pseudomonas putida]GLO32880.1 hypothetical protein PPUN12996_49390 [Pseudomonas putida]
MTNQTTSQSGNDGWQEFEHCGQRWSFNEDELAQLDEEDGSFHFVRYHRLQQPDIECVKILIDDM